MVILARVEMAAMATAIALAHLAQEVAELAVHAVTDEAAVLVYLARALMVLAATLVATPLATLGAWISVAARTDQALQPAPR